VGLELHAWGLLRLTKRASSAQEEASRGRNQFCGRPLGGARAPVSSLGHLGVSWGVLGRLGVAEGALSGRERESKEVGQK